MFKEATKQQIYLSLNGFLLAVKESDSFSFCNERQGGGGRKGKSELEAFSNSLLARTCGFSGSALDLLCARRSCKECSMEFFSEVTS